jgi:uncharacterized protein involved in oxidation of intracellular sulfur
MKLLIVLNDPPYGSERAFNGLRLAVSAARKPGVQVRIFLIGDAAACAKRGQKVPAGYYNIQSLLESAVRGGAEIGVCGTCMDARGLEAGDLVEGARRGSMDELTTWTLESDQVLSF